MLWTSGRPEFDAALAGGAGHGQGSEAVSGVAAGGGQVSLVAAGTRAWEQELMERVVKGANLVKALGRVCANKGSAGINHIRSSRRSGKPRGLWRRSARPGSDRHTLI